MNNRDWAHGGPTDEECDEPHIENKPEVIVWVFAANAGICPHAMCFKSISAFVTYVAMHGARCCNQFAVRTQVLWFNFLKNISPSLFWSAFVLIVLNSWVLLQVARLRFPCFMEEENQFEAKHGSRDHEVVDIKNGLNDKYLIQKDKPK